MKSLNAFALLFVLTVLPVSAELVTDPETGRKTGTITVNGATYEIKPNADLANADLSGADLYLADLSGADLRQANLTDAGLRRAFFREANLRDADLRGADLGATDLRDADLRDADLRDADLSGIDLREANLIGADLTGVRSGDIFGVPSALPSDWSIVNGYLIGPGANLSFAFLSGEDLSSADLDNANLRDADLRGADLSDADLSFADLSFAGLRGLDLTNANLIGTDLTGVRSGEIFGVPSALPSDWSFVNGYLIGPGANLRDADLRGLDLRGANLSGAYLSGANLSGADLTGVIRNDRILDPRIAELEAQLAAAIAERDERPTVEQIQDARAGSIVLVADRDNNEVTLRFKVEETENLKQGTWTTVQGGDISLKVPLEQGNKFMRIALGE